MDQFLSAILVFLMMALSGSAIAASTNDLEFEIPTFSSGVGSSLYVGTNRGLIVSRDGGNTFFLHKDIPIVDKDDLVRDIFVRGNIILAPYEQHYLAPNTTFYLSQDSGQSFKLKTAPARIIFTEIQNNKIYMYTANGVYISSDWGDTFSLALPEFKDDFIRYWAFSEKEIYVVLQNRGYQFHRYDENFKAIDTLTLERKSVSCNMEIRSVEKIYNVKATKNKLLAEVWITTADHTNTVVSKRITLSSDDGFKTSKCLSGRRNLGLNNKKSTFFQQAGSELLLVDENELVQEQIPVPLSKEIASFYIDDQVIMLNFYIENVTYPRMPGFYLSADRGVTWRYIDRIPATSVVP